MEKIYTYMMITTVIMILLFLFGFATVTGAILGKMGLTSPDALSNIQSTYIYVYIVGVALVAIIALTAISLISKTVSDLPITALFASALLVTFIGDMASVISYVSSSWEKWILFVIVAPYVTAYAVAIYDWVRGKD